VLTNHRVAAAVALEIREMLIDGISQAELITSDD